MVGVPPPSSVGAAQATNAVELRIWVATLNGRNVPGKLTVTELDGGDDEVFEATTDAVYRAPLVNPVNRHECAAANTEQVVVVVVDPEVDVSVTTEPNTVPGGGVHITVSRCVRAARVTFEGAAGAGACAPPSVKKPLFAVFQCAAM